MLDAKGLAEEWLEPTISVDSSGRSAHKPACFFPFLVECALAISASADREVVRANAGYVGATESLVRYALDRATDQEISKRWAEVRDTQGFFEPVIDRARALALAQKSRRPKKVWVKRK